MATFPITVPIKDVPLPKESKKEFEMKTLSVRETEEIWSVKPPNALVHVIFDLEYILEILIAPVNYKCFL